jgi:hypothetical protein
MKTRRAHLARLEDPDIALRPWPLLSPGSSWWGANRSACNRGTQLEATSPFSLYTSTSYFLSPVILCFCFFLSLFTLLCYSQCSLTFFSLLIHCLPHLSVVRLRWFPFLEYFPLIRHEPYRIRRLQQFFVAAGRPLPSCYLATIWGYTYRPTVTRVQKSSIVACVFVAARTCLPSRCLAMIRGYIYRHTDWWEGFMKYAVEMGSGAMIYIPSFVRTGSAN